VRVADADSIVVEDVIPSRDRGGGDGGEVLRGARGRADVPPPARADDHRGRQRFLHLPDDEPAAAPPRLPRRVEGGVRQAAGQQHPDARDRGGALGRRDDSRHDGREPRLREGRVPEARLPRRYDLRGDRGGGQARVAVASAVGHRHLRAPGEEPARRRRHAGAPERDDAQAGYLMRRRRSLHFVPGGNEKMLLSIRWVASASPRVVAISWGVEDLGAAMSLARVRDAEGRYLDIPRHARVMCAVAAAAAGVDALDTVYTDIADLAGLRRECE